MQTIADETREVVKKMWERGQGEVGAVVWKKVGEEGKLPVSAILHFPSVSLSP